jgi:hypothetical protein
MDFDEWLALGVANGWVSGPRCVTHDGIVSSAEEEAAFDAGRDPCQHVLRLWPDGPDPSQHWVNVGEPPRTGSVRPAG